MAEYQTGNEAERQAGDFWLGEAAGLGGGLPQWEQEVLTQLGGGSQRGAGNDNIQRLKNTKEVGKSRFQL